MVDQNWVKDFQRRMDRYNGLFQPKRNEQLVSIKLRPVSGCFGRCCCPESYVIADRLKEPKGKTLLVVEEHESGPEIITVLKFQLAAVGISLAANVISLITAMLNARRLSRRKGESVKVIIRMIKTNGAYKEEEVLEVDCVDPVTELEIEKEMVSATTRLVDETSKLINEAPSHSRH